MHRWRDNLLSQFAVASLAIVAILALSVSFLISRITARSVLAEAERVAQEDVAERVMHALTIQDFEHPLEGERHARFADHVDRWILNSAIERVKLWGAGGALLFSTEAVSGDEHTHRDPQLEMALSGQIASQIVAHDGDEGTSGRGHTLIEVYTPVVDPTTSEIVGVIEIYQPLAPYTSLITAIRNGTLLITLPAAGLLYTLLLMIVRKGWRTIQLQRADIEQLATFPRENPNPVMAATHDGTVRYANDAARQLLAELQCNDPRRLLPAAHDRMVRESLAEGKERTDLEVTCGERVVTWRYYPLPEHELVHLYGMDITHRKRAEQQLLYDAFHDALTGLPNRTLFMDRLGHALDRTRRHEGQRFAVLFLDLDQFKMINDSLGHTHGDRLLIEVSARLRDSLRPADSVARLGGDDFVLLLEDLDDVHEATSIAHRLLEDLRTPLHIDEREHFVSASIGIVFVDGAETTPSAADLMRDAEIAMYRAKSTGKARYALFDATMHEGVLARLTMETDLRGAIDRGEFFLVYQPIISLHSGSVRGFEALVRWRHPERGLVSPGAFIPLAEENGLIVPIGRWVLREACHQLRAWQERFPIDPPLQISVNMSGRQLTQADLIEQIDEVLEQSGICASALKLEITESVIIDSVEAVAERLAQLQARGIEVQMDDFGTGYSSLSYLHQFPIDTIKIDRSFIRRLDEAEENAEIVRTIVLLAQGLGKEVVAEGVESVTQLERLRQFGCRFAQGYLFSRPLESDHVAELLAAPEGRLLPLEPGRNGR